MINEIKINKYKEFEQIKNSSFGKWYYVCYIRNYKNYYWCLHNLGLNNLEYNSCTAKLKLDDISKFNRGKGLLFFIDLDNKSVVFNWYSIISMIPGEK